ncbi:hypothetical protein L9F63_014942 [Diploptera punctata]|uniref:C2H2-type domain-containing protein n=1 Tax=Diploptera punctata TaxID=6984 RepID=A0AAD8A6S8_DIPPU|nr:hypothetical protein L9F63_014942 [Diploptera punctata]
MGERDSEDVTMHLQQVVMEENKWIKSFIVYFARKVTQLNVHFKDTNDMNVEWNLSSNVIFCDRRFNHRFHLKSHLIVHEKYSGFYV